MTVHTHTHTHTLKSTLLEQRVVLNVMLSMGTRSSSSSTSNNMLYLTGAGIESRE